MKRSGIYFPLVLGVLFGFAIGLLPISPALGENIPVCQGGPSTTAKISLGGRVITPTEILRVGSVDPCTGSETILNMVTLTRTLVVSPKATPVQSGDALIAALSTISSNSPSVTNPWLLKLEPGLYDLNGRALNSLPFVDIEGSGEDTTVITSLVNTNILPADAATVIMNGDSELRFLKVVNSGSATNKVGVLVAPNSLNNKVTNTTINTNGAGNNVGLEVTNASSVMVQNSTFSATGGLNSSGAYNYAGILFFNNSNSIAANGSSNNGLFNNAGGVSTIQNSTLIGLTHSITSLSGTVKVGASQLNGPRLGTLVCAASFDGSFVALNATCG